MGFGSFFHHLVAPITKALGPIGTAALLPAIPLTQAALKVVDVGVSAITAPSHTASKVPQQATYQPAPYLQRPYYAAPTYYAPTYAAPSYGGSPWDSSTRSLETYPAFSQELAPTPLPMQDSSTRPWEDLVAASTLVGTFL